MLLGLTGVIVGLSAWTLSASKQDIFLLTGFLLASGIVSLIIGLAALKINQGRLLRSVQHKLLFSLLLSATLVLANVGFTSYLMFISSHDLTLLSLLMLFSLAISAFVASRLASRFHSSLRELVDAARAMGRGDLTARAPLHDGDELGELALTFNGMADQLEAAFVRQHDLQQVRRELVAAVSHDLRTPLATMRAMVESINDEVVSDQETVSRYMHTLQGEIEYLSRLIDDLFELSQIDSGLLQLTPEIGSVPDLISDTLEALSAQAQQRRLTLSGDVSQRMPAVMMDTRRVQRVLYNLVQNSVRHTPADGAIVIRAVNDEHEVRVSVVDTGVGIPANEIPQIFSRFHQVSNKARNRQQGGSGLGLSIAKGIVELHGGRIWAESVYGKGSTFTFTLPRGDGAKAQALATKTISAEA